VWGSGESTRSLSLDFWLVGSTCCDGAAVLVCWRCCCVLLLIVVDRWVDPILGISGAGGAVVVVSQFCCESILL
jgi:hypothetical protein